VTEGAVSESGAGPAQDMGSLRVIDAGSVSALDSQALWHGIAEAITPGQPPVLSFCRPAEPYVGIGYHRRLDELDPGALAELGLPVIRRQIGGGPVYLDQDQLFFQITLPARAAQAGPARLYAQMLTPVVEALRELGVPAELCGTNDVVVAGRKVSGTGSGQIGDGVVVVGNVMFAFPHERMARILALPDEEMRLECLRLMRAHLGPLPQLKEPALKEALTRAYGRALDARPQPSRPHERERRAIARWRRRLGDPAWSRGPVLPVPSGRQVKIRAGTWIYDGSQGSLRVRATVEEGRLRRLALTDGQRRVPTAAIARALLGASATRSELDARLERFGDAGRAVLATLSPGLVVR
jgi:lipoate-protein ligase A